MKTTYSAIVAALFISSLALESPARADGEWFHKKIEAKQDLGLRLDYTFTGATAGRGGHYRYAKAYVHVWRKDLASGDQVRVDIHASFPGPAVQTLELKFDQDHFVAEVPKDIVVQWSNDGSTWRFVMPVSLYVSINGSPQTPPGGTTLFNVELDKDPGRLSSN